MKVYSCPEEVKFAEPDYRNFDLKVEEARIQKHKEDLKAWLIGQGYTGKNTGEVVSFPVADGYAQYMVGEARSLILIHLPYYDAYHYRMVDRFTKKEILAEIERSKKMSALFASKAA